MLSRSAKHSSLSRFCVMSSSPSNSENICQFFDRGKYCRFGRRCKFLHIRSSRDSTENPSCNSKQATVSVEKVREGVEATSVSVASTPVQHEVPEQRKLCFFFSKHNRCKYGKGCRFEHIRDEVLAETKSDVKKNKDVKEDNEIKDIEEEEEPEKSSSKQASQDEAKRRPKRVCRYFKAGFCSMGQRCRFRHPEDLVAVKKEAGEGKDGEENVSGQSKQTRQKYRPQARPNIFTLENLSSEDLKKCRSDEIAQLKKRYPKSEENTDEKSTKIQFIFVPSDPEWPYDVKSVPVVLEFKDDYPQSQLDVSFVETSEIPATVHRIMSQSVRSWLQLRFESFSGQGKVEQVVRPMLKWFDRNIEEMFTTGLKQYQKELMAKAAGLTFVTASELQEQYASHSQESDASNEDGQDDEENEDSDEEEEEEESGEEMEEEEHVSRQLVSDPAARGTEIRFQNLQLKNSLATLLATKVALQVQCTRCRGRTDLTTPETRVNAVSCSTCGTVSTVAFRAAMIHANSAVMGYVDVDGCTVFDVVLPECTFMAGCLTCSKEMLLEGASTGQPKDTWCRSCNAKMRLVADSVRLLRLQPAIQQTETNVHKVDAKQKRVPKDPAIQDGLPLPNDGICKHYKKSYRWFRFPCCGKAFPCDICHDEKEDHTYTYANRMICGHCAKEQSYAAERPCIRCGESLTKKSSSHWEGGKGCRDKIKMARDDAKKYSNLNKTVSRKAKGIATGKKNTKLRHT